MTVSFQSLFFLFGFFGNIIVIIAIGLEKGWHAKSSSCFALNLDMASEFSFSNALLYNISYIVRIIKLRPI